MTNPPPTPASEGRTRQAEANDCARAIGQIVDPFCRTGLPMHVCTKIVQCVGVAIESQNAALLRTNEEMRKALEIALNLATDGDPVLESFPHSRLSEISVIVRRALAAPGQGEGSP